MFFVIVGIVVGVVLINTFATTERNKNGGRGWNHTENITYR